MVVTVVVVIPVVMLMIMGVVMATVLTRSGDDSSVGDDTGDVGCSEGDGGEPESRQGGRVGLSRWS